ncbi:putative nuclease HARBI1 [Heterodontus francisci]|uniref:putative nuclease HARBI1 n=1 Tax=Heterodontus francisci TaxID=7792 RepID=UPI00355C8C2F
MCGVSQSVAHHCIMEVINALFRSASYYVRYRADPESQAERAIGLGAITGFPQVQVAIDCTHEAIKAPTDQPATFINRKGFILLMYNLYVTTESTSYKCVPANREAATTHSYFSSPRNPSNDAEERYSACQSSTRATIEQAIALLKMWFCCLDRSRRALQYSPQKAGCIVVVCCDLHKIALQREETLTEEDMWEYETSSEKEDTEDTQGQAAMEGPSRVMEDRHPQQHAREARQNIIMERF